ncbi:MAG: tRNA (adenosine(37)-N6)-threonylcarbamoyltransferase complex dimerization subunit type 1 TsaB [Clostridia bacterium]|nr:tRNA (adenosine(37)-N6)-threonylcarbamoyltransferase complex dimerization subunit type 1 TsaB [Clostridia bacterium]
MKVLAIETSSLVASVAAVEDGRLLGEYTINHKKTHSQKLMPMIKALMDTLEIAPKDIDLYAASSGPGSFTGLRIGITTIKAIAYSLDKPVLGVPTLDALAYNIPNNECMICPIMDARNDQVYTALYKWENNKQIKCTEDMGIPVTELIEMVKAENKEIIFVGDAVPKHQKLISSTLSVKSHFAPENLMLQRAASVAQLALIIAAGGRMEKASDMVPFYLRKSQAEREYEKKGLI